MIAALTRGEQLNAAIEIATSELRKHQGHEEVIRAVDAARTLAAAGRPDSEALARLGGGWVAEEALGIAVCCALVAEDFSDGVRLAVNHSGDSDSTGAMTGNLLGAQLGVASIPAHWLKNLELRDEIDRIACDLCHFSTAEGFSEEDFAAYRAADAYGSAGVTPVARRASWL